ncbi:apoptosis-associated speck-like protein containing a CARD [Brienomyrus brachyistius]|uniref:apoptosis-associated speck-like protein containing a CARD n=1 Tax=Brienomyrus brachyistius TaxID=42636 RepID=UPI0020B38780|nr:apoptosis-associated speck-like protein containing a CARD [Brienomyrus brachyistius]XP_048867731.1 apoptosis-associated speck-like protein containing a CARD [Brienomyrus brachyistius]
MAYHSRGETQTSLADLLLDYLEEISDEELKRFKWKLSNTKYKELKPLPRGQVMGLDRTDLADKMISCYSKVDALNVMLEILKKMNLNDLAQRLDEDLQKGTQAESQQSAIPAEAPRPVVPNQIDVLFVDRHRTALIQRVSLIDPILDDLHGNIGGEKYNNIRAGSTSQDRMRRLYEALNTDSLKELFFASLNKKEPHLVSELKRS